MKQPARVYATLLYLYPAEFRRRYAHELTLLFVDMHRAAAIQGMPSVIDLWLHTCVDLVFTALRERFMERSRVMFSPKVTLWGGLAGVAGGLFWLMIVGSATSGVVSGGLALLLGLGGLTSLYSQQARQGGKLGLAGFALGIIGTVLTLATTWWASISGGFDPRTIGAVIVAPRMLIISLAFVTLGIGLVLLGVASLRAKTLDRWWGLPLGLGLLNVIQGIAIWLDFYVPLSQGQDPIHPYHPGVLALLRVLFVLLGLGWMVLGSILAVEAYPQVAPPPPASA